MEWYEPALWSALGAAIVTVAVGLVRAFLYYRRGSVAVTAEEATLAEDHRVRVRRDANDEAWQLNDRLQTIIQSQDLRLRELEEKYEKIICEMETNFKDELEKCEQDRRRWEVAHARQEGRIGILEAWARSKGLKIPVGLLGDGSGSHPPLPPPTGAGQ